MKQSDKRDKVDQKDQTSADILVKKTMDSVVIAIAVWHTGCPENTVVTHTLGLSSREMEKTV